MLLCDVDVGDGALSVEFGEGGLDLSAIGCKNELVGCIYFRVSREGL